MVKYYIANKNKIDKTVFIVCILILMLITIKISYEDKKYYKEDQEAKVKEMLGSRNIKWEELEENINYISTLDTVKLKYDRIGLIKKLKNISEEEFIKLLQGSSYISSTDDLDSYNPITIFKNKPITCEAYTLLIMEYINTNYIIPENVSIKPIMLLSDNAHMYIQYSIDNKVKNIDLSSNIFKEAALKDVSYLLINLERR